MGLQQLFDSEELEVSFLEGKSDFLLITFSALDFSTKTDAFWGRYFAEKNGLSALGFVAKSNNWYPQGIIRECLPAVLTKIEHFKQRITYGSSMGAYAAIKYSRALGATASAAFGPQFSIDPADGIKLSSYTSYYKPEYHADMAIKNSDVGENCFVFHDQTDDFDRNNANYIASVAPWAKLVRLRNVGHEAIKILGNSANTIKMLKLCLAGEEPEVRKFMLALRATSSGRYCGVASALAPRNKELSRKIYDIYKDKFDPKQRALYFYELAAACAADGEFDSARELMTEALDILPGRPPFVIRLREINAQAANKRG